MKKVIFLFVCAAVMATGILKAQENKRAIGLRLGYDAQEITYQQLLTQFNRLELTLGVNTFGRNSAGNFCRGIGLNGVYQWLNDLSSVAAGLNWYHGFGAAVLLHGDLFGAGVLGQIGVEYNFNSAIRLSVDYRPGFYWLPGAGNVFRFSWNVPCVSIRYLF
jgi:hypothetical protein